jgi:hypothetical protein
MKDDLINFLKEIGSNTYNSSVDNKHMVSTGPINDVYYEVI